MATMTNLDFPTCSPVELLEVQHEHAWTRDHAVHHAGHPCHFLFGGMFAFFCQLIRLMLLHAEKLSKTQRFSRMMGANLKLIMKRTEMPTNSAVRQCSVQVTFADLWRVEPMLSLVEWHDTEGVLKGSQPKPNLSLKPWLDKPFGWGLEDHAVLTSKASARPFIHSWFPWQSWQKHVLSRRLSMSWRPWRTWTFRPAVQSSFLRYSMNKGPCRASCRSSMSKILVGIFAYFCPLIRLMLLHTEKLSKTQRFSRMMGGHLKLIMKRTEMPRGSAVRQCSVQVTFADLWRVEPMLSQCWANVEPCGVTWYWRCSERKSAQTKFVIETMARWNVWLGPWRWTPCWPPRLRPDHSFTRGFHDKAGKKHVFSRRPSMSWRPWRTWTFRPAVRSSFLRYSMNKGPCRASCRSSMSFFFGWRWALLHIFANWFDWCYFTQRNCPRRRGFHVWWGPFETDNEAHWNAKRQCSATVQCAGYFCRPLEGWANVEPCGVTWYWRCSERKSAQTKFVIETMARWNVWLGPWRWTPCLSSMPRPGLLFTRGFHDKAGKNMCSVVSFPCHGDHDERGLSDLQSGRASWGTAWTRDHAVHHGGHPCHFFLGGTGHFCIFLPIDSIVATSRREIVQDAEVFTYDGGHLKLIMKRTEVPRGSAVRQCSVQVTFADQFGGLSQCWALRSDMILKVFWKEVSPNQICHCNHGSMKRLAGALKMNAVLICNASARPFIHPWFPCKAAKTCVQSYSLSMPSRSSRPWHLWWRSFADSKRLQSFGLCRPLEGWVSEGAMFSCILIFFSLPLI